jgi:hypothetical protein
MKSTFRFMVRIAAVALASAVPGAAASAAEVAVPVENRAPAPAEAHGFVQLISEALAGVTVNADQEAEIEKLGAHLEPLQIELDKAEGNLLASLAEQVKSETIDRAALQPEIASYVAARETLAKPLHEALEDLHEMLDRQQRADFADALECSVYEVTRALLSHDKLVAFEEKLDLDAAQTQDVKDAFFSVEPFFPLAQVGAKAARRANRIIDVTEAILDVLDRDQVDKLAAAIAEAAQAKLEPPSGTPEAGKPSEPVEVHAWIAGRVRGFGRFGRPMFIGSAARHYAWRVTPFPVVAAYGWGL